MSKIEKKLQKNIKVTKDKKKKEDPLKNQILAFVKVIYILIILSIFIYGITVVVNKAYKLEEKETIYDSSEILVGQTFSKLEEEYYVAFYSFKDANDLTTTIKDITDKPIYKVNLDLGNNKFVISNTGNDQATTSETLKINGPTIIKIVNGKNYEYIEGLENVKGYLTDLK